MLTEALYVATIFGILFLLIFISFYLLLLIYSWMKGAPYVATKRREIEDMLRDAHLKENQLFVELGCGDGRVVRTAVEKYKVKGIGIDINPYLIFLAKIRSKNIAHLQFLKQNILTADLSKADVIYIFLFPALIEKLKDSLLNGMKQDVLIISHGFKIPYLNLKNSHKGRVFTTYYYNKHS